MRGCRVSTVAAVLFPVVSLVAPLRAAEAPAEAGAGVVVFAVDPRAKDTQAMVDAVRAHLTGLPVRLVIEPPGASRLPDATGAGRILGTLTIDPGTPGEWVVSFTEPAVDTTLVRRIRLKPQGTRVALEEAAIVVRSMVEAILDGGHVGIARAAEVAQEGRGSAGRASRHGLALTAGYMGTTFASRLGWQSGALIGARWQLAPLYAGVTYGIVTSLATETRPASLLLIRHPGAIVFGYEGAARVAPILEVQLVVDYVRRHTIATDVGYVVTPDASRWMFGLGAQAGLSWSVLPRFRLLAQGGIEWMLNPYSYVALPDVVVTPASVRPKVAIGLGVDLW